MADFDGDGDMDVVGATVDPLNPLVVFLNDGSPLDGGWLDQAVALPYGYAGVANVTTADVNLDGTPDIVAAGGGFYCSYQTSPYDYIFTCNSGPFAVLWFAGNRAPGGGVVFSEQPVLATNQMPYSVQVATHLELLFSEFRSSSVREDDDLPDFLVGTGDFFSFFRQQPDHSFEPAQTPYEFGFSAAQVTAVFGTDFARDGSKDLGFTVGGPNLNIDAVSLCSFDGGVAWRCLAASTGSEDGGPILASPADMIAVDLDADGDDDFAIASRDYLWMVRNQRSHAQFTAASGPQEPFEVAVPQDAFVGDLVIIQEGRIRLGARPGDSAARLETFGLQFIDTSLPPGSTMPGNPLTSAQANALIEELLVFRGDGNGIVEPGKDVLVLTVPDPVRLPDRHNPKHQPDPRSEQLNDCGQTVHPHLTRHQILAVDYPTPYSLLPDRLPVRVTR